MLLLMRWAGREGPRLGLAGRPAEAQSRPQGRAGAARDGAQAAVADGGGCLAVLMSSSTGQGGGMGTGLGHERVLWWHRVAGDEGEDHVHGEVRRKISTEKKKQRGMIK